MWVRKYPHSPILLTPGPLYHVIYLFENQVSDSKARLFAGTSLFPDLCFSFFVCYLAMVVCSCNVDLLEPPFFRIYCLFLFVYLFIAFVFCFKCRLLLLRGLAAGQREQHVVGTPPQSKSGGSLVNPQHNYIPGSTPSGDQVLVGM